MKDATGVGVELGQIYFPGRRSHQPNARQQTSPNYITVERGSLPLVPSERQAEGEGPKAHTGGDGICCPCFHRNTSPLVHVDTRICILAKFVCRGDGDVLIT
jgi:hypothetical protein